MSHEFDPDTGEVLVSTQLRDAALSLLPSLALKNALEVKLTYPIERKSGISFVDVEYEPSEAVSVAVVETEKIETSLDGKLTIAEYSGTRKTCVIILDTGEIDIYVEVTGKLNHNEYFVEDEYDPRPLEPSPEPKTPEERLIHTIWGTPQSDADAFLESARWDVMMFTQEKLNVLFGHFVELGISQPTDSDT